MAGGSTSAESDDDQQCIHCGRWFGSPGLLPHERNCEWQDSDRRMQPLEDPLAKTRADDVDAGDLEDAAPEPHAETIMDDPTDGVASDPGQGAGGGAPRSDGGTPAPPPEPDPAPSDDGDGGSSDPDDDLPERYVTVEDYLAACREQGVDEATVTAIRERLEQFDVVDVEETTSETIAAYTFGEI